MDISVVVNFLANMCYVALGTVALWGAFSVIVVWRRVSQSRFRNEESQEEFLSQLDEALRIGDFDAVIEMCEDDARVIPQLALLTVSKRGLGYAKLKSFVVDRYQRDVLGDLEHRLSWVYTVIKSAPMLGLFGTVLGMMGAFAKLATGGENVDPTALAGDIQVALITTALGLAIAIPLTLCTTSINIRIRQLEDLVGIGLTRLFEAMRPLLEPVEAKR